MLADIRAQVAAGAQHITFGDPDFFNGPTHALAHRRGAGARVPGRQLRRHDQGRAPEKPRRRCCRGCATRAARSSPAPSSRSTTRCWRKLEKGHTHADFVAVVEHCRSIGLTLSPTFVAFTPWTTLDELRRRCCARSSGSALVPAVSPIQYAIRLLIPQGSRMLELADVRALIERVRSAVAGAHLAASRSARRRAAAGRRAAGRRAAERAARGGVRARLGDRARRGRRRRRRRARRSLSRAAVPYLNEPWYC